MSEESTVKITASLPESLHARLKRVLADQRGNSINAVVNASVLAYVVRHEEQSDASV